MELDIVITFLITFLFGVCAIGAAIGALGSSGVEMLMLMIVSMMSLVIVLLTNIFYEVRNFNEAVRYAADSISGKRRERKK